MKQKPRTLGEQLKDLKPKDTFKDRNQTMMDAQKAKEEPPLYAVMGTERVTDLYSLERARKIASEINGKVWSMVRDNEDITLLFPIE